MCLRLTRRARRWLQGECRGLGGADAPEVDPALQRAAAALRERPVLFRYCAEEVREALTHAASPPHVACVRVSPYCKRSCNFALGAHGEARRDTHVFILQAVLDFCIWRSLSIKQGQVSSCSALSQSTGAQLTAVRGGEPGSTRAAQVAAARHAALFQRFIAALTRGGPGGMPRPIEMHAHDPRRYLGDTLAWVHQVGRPG